MGAAAPPSSPPYDAVVIGGGPGGSTAATLLARAGRRVLVLERERFPRFRIGESLLPLNRRIFERLGVAEDLERTFIRKYGAHFAKGDGSREYTYEFKNAMECPYEYAYQVKRADLDRILLDNARRAGAEVREGWLVEDVLFEGEQAVGVRARPADGAGTAVAAGGAIRAAFVVDASGRASFLGQRLKLRRADPLFRKSAVFAHFRGVRRLEGKHEGTITVATFEGGWFWLIPFNDDTASVGAVLHHDYWQAHTGEPAERMLEGAIERCAPIRDRMTAAERVTPAYREGSFSYKCDRFGGPGWVLCGDAAAFLDPVFSSGVMITMSCAEIIAAAIDGALARGDRSAAVFASYEKRMRRGMGIFFKFIHGFYDPSFIELFLQPTTRFQLINAVTGVLAGNLFPTLKFKLRIWTLDLIIGIARWVYWIRGRYSPNRSGA